MYVFTREWFCKDLVIQRPFFYGNTERIGISENVIM